MFFRVSCLPKLVSQTEARRRDKMYVCVYLKSTYIKYRSCIDKNYCSFQVDKNNVVNNRVMCAARATLWQPHVARRVILQATRNSIGLICPELCELSLQSILLSFRALVTYITINERKIKICSIDRCSRARMKRNYYTQSSINK